MLFYNELFDKPSAIKIFICGIGGIGTSALAVLARNCGCEVFGSNEEENKNTKRLRELGFNVFIGHKAENLQDCNLFVYSRAIDINTNVEAIEATARHIPKLERGEMLAILMSQYYNIVIAGSHGKTTTTGFISHTLKQLKLKPNILLGGVLNEIHLNCETNTGKYFVVESDESDGSFLRMPANIGIITNIDPEHMEFYKTKENLAYYFLKFAENAIKQDGLIICIDDEIGRNILAKLNNKKNNIITYSFDNTKADFYAKNIELKQDGLAFIAVNNITKTEENVFIANMFGEINASNALVSFAIGQILKQSSKRIAEAFASFQGIQKRFTITGKIHDTLVVDDYAHNPQKIDCAIGSAKHYMKGHNMNGKLIVIFEPHRYTRVRDGIDLFAKSFEKVDYLITLPIYASSEHEIEGINNEFVYTKCKNNNPNTFKCELDAKKIAELLKSINVFDKQNLIVFMGAGRSTKMAHEIVDVVV